MKNLEAIQENVLIINEHATFLIVIPEELSFPKATAWCELNSCAQQFHH